MAKEIVCYMDGVDFQHELGEAAGGTRLYRSIEDLKKHSDCWVECGIVKVKVILVEWVEDQNFGKLT